MTLEIVVAHDMAMQDHCQLTVVRGDNSTRIMQKGVYHSEFIHSSSYVCFAIMLQSALNCSSNIPAIMSCL